MTSGESTRSGPDCDRAPELRKGAPEAEVGCRGGRRWGVLSGGWDASSEDVDNDRFHSMVGRSAGHHRATTLSGPDPLWAVSVGLGRLWFHGIDVGHRSDIQALQVR